MRDTGCEVRDVRERWAGHVARVPHPASRIWEEATRVIGCQDFCGHYDWTFEYLRREFGEEAVRDYWEQAISVDSQRHARAR